MSRIYCRWTEEDLVFLKNNYNHQNKELLLDQLAPRKWPAIRKKASVLGLKHDHFRKSDLRSLLAENPRAYYWMGFLAADGHFTPRRIQLGVAQKDLGHLKRFMQFIHSSHKIYKLKGQDHYRIKCGHTEVVEKIRSKFGIESCKTYSPLDLSQVNQEADRFLPFVIGFIDGDGCTDGKYSISIVSHPNWLENLAFMRDYVYDYFNVTGIRNAPRIKTVYTQPPGSTKKKRYHVCVAHLCGKRLLQGLKRKAEEYGLPFLQRKLGQVSL